MRVALVSSSFDPHVGGVETHVRQVARELAAMGHEIEVWTVDRGERLGERVLGGLRVRYLPTPLPARSFRAMGVFLGRVPGAWHMWQRACDDFRPQLLHVHCFGPNGLYALALHRRRRIPLAVTSHGETLGDDTGVFQQSALLRRGLREALLRSAFVTAPSSYVVDDLRAAYGLVSGDVVPNGVDLDVVPSWAPTDDEPYLLAVGRLGRMKGFDLLIDAYARSGVAVDHRLLIGGDGPEGAALALQAEKRGVADRVRLIGRLSDEEVAGAMAGARAVVVPSRSEAFGIVALEAWRARTALIMTSRGGGPSFVRDREDALLVDPQDIEALAASLRDVTRDVKLRERLAVSGRLRVHDYTWDRVARAYEYHYGAVFTSGGVTATGAWGESAR